MPLVPAFLALKYNRHMTRRRINPNQAFNYSVFACLCLIASSVAQGAIPVTKHKKPHSTVAKHTILMSAPHERSNLLSGNLATFPPNIPWDSTSQGAYVTALTRDGSGNLWVGTEGNGIWEFTRSFSSGPYAWKQFTNASTSGAIGDDNCYSLACDGLGRLWATTMFHGLAVYNGTAWRSFDPANGPLGSHILALARDPLTGDMWGASEQGLFRYSLYADKWSYFTTANGLPSNQATGLAFDSSGTLYVATACSGIAISSPATHFQHWQTVPGPERMPTTAFGRGLPCALTNAVIVTHNGNVFVGTDCGLAFSSDKGKSWIFLRGADWKDKTKGQWQGATTQDIGQTPPLLSEDYVTCLAQDTQGTLWIGHRQTGVELRNPIDLSVVHAQPSTYGNASVDSLSQTYVASLLSLGNGTVLAGQYATGLSTALDSKYSPASEPAWNISKGWQGNSPPHLPEYAVSPDAQSLALMSRQIKSWTQPLTQSASYAGEDWVTKGDWVGHYGRQYARLCAMDNIIAANHKYSADDKIGPLAQNHDGIRWWVTWLTTSNINSLYSPMLGTRKQAEWDDHGETYPMSQEGPDIWSKVTADAGSFHRLSLYFFNKDGENGSNRDRDFLIQIKPDRPTLADAMQAPTLAEARVRNFYGGVYEQFIIRTPGTYYVRVARNNSFNTILSGVFLDTIGSDKVVANKQDLAAMNGVSYRAPQWNTPSSAVAVSSPASRLLPTLAVAEAVWSSLDTSTDCPIQSVAMPQVYRLLAYRAALAAQAPSSLLASWRWNLGIWTQEDRTDFDSTMAYAWDEKDKPHWFHIPAATTVSQTPR